MKPGCPHLILAAILSASVFTLASFADDHAGHGATPAAAAKADEFKGDPYPLKVDPVTDEALPEKPVVYQAATGEVRFASDANLQTFKANPAPYVAKIAKAITELQTQSYAAEVCPSTDEKLGSMGDPATEVIGNRLVKFCCGGCVDDAKKDPKSTFAKLDAAVIAKQKPTYPIDTCLISGEKLGADATDLVIGTRLLRLCCDDCADEVRKNPLKAFTKLDAAIAAKKP